jgi:hypothetical protein
MTEVKRAVSKPPNPQWNGSAKYKFLIKGDALTTDRKTVNFELILYDNVFESYDSSISKFRRHILDDVLKKRDPNIFRHKTAYICRVESAEGIVKGDGIFQMDKPELIAYIIEKGYVEIKPDLYFDTPSLREAIYMYEDSKEAFLRIQGVKEKMLGNRIDLAKINDIETTEVVFGNEQL